MLLLPLPTYPLESMVVLRLRKRVEEVPFAVVGEYLCEKWYGIGEMVLCCLCLIPKTGEDRANSISVSPLTHTHCSQLLFAEVVKSTNILIFKFGLVNLFIWKGITKIKVMQMVQPRLPDHSRTRVDVTQNFFFFSPFWVLFLISYQLNVAAQLRVHLKPIWSSVLHHQIKLQQTFVIRFKLMMTHQAYLFSYYPVFWQMLTSITRQCC